MKQQEALQQFQTHFAAYEERLNGNAGSPDHLRRKTAMQQLADTGLPTLRDEDWRYTNLNPVLKTGFVPSTMPKKEVLTIVNTREFLPDVQSAARLVFVDGHFIAELSQLTGLPQGCTISSLSSAVAETPELISTAPAGVTDSAVRQFTLLNSAFAEEGAYIRAAAGCILEDPVHLLFLSSGAPQPCIHHPRIILHAEKGSEFTVIEQYAALETGVHFTNTVVESTVAEGAHLHHIKLQDESPEAFHISATYARVSRNASYDNHYFGLGSRLVRNNIHAVFEDEQAECTLNGLFLPRDSQHMDHHTVIDHAQPRCNSHELYKGILNGESRGVFSGKIVVRKDAQQTDARQASNNLLLSEDAVVDTKPQLEIWADDVKCTHGATIGRMDDEALFYLRSRGIALAEARNMLSQAFASELVSRVRNEALRSHLDSLIQQRLESSRKDG